MKNRRRFIAILFFAAIGIRTGSTEDLPNDVTILTQKDFLGRPYYSIADALQHTTSFNLQRDGVRGTPAVGKMRGLSNPNQLAILIDGQPVNPLFDYSVDLSQIPITIAQRIEITRGGGSLAYTGQGAGGVVNIITHRPDRKGMSTRLGTGIGRYSMKDSQGQIKGRSHIGDMTYAGAVQEGAGYLEEEFVEGQTHFGNFTRSFKGKGYWGADYLYQHDEVGIRNGTPVPFDIWNNHLEREPSNKEEARVTEMQKAQAFLAYPLLSGGTVYADLTRAWRSRQDRVSREGYASRDQDNAHARADVRWRRKGFEAGAETHQMTRSIWSEAERSVYQTSFYLLNKWTSNRFTVLPALRYDNNTKGGSHFLPRVALVYRTGGDLFFSASAQKSHRPPNFDELYLSSGAVSNPNLESEKGKSYDVGANWAFFSNGRLKVTGFYSRLTDTIGVDPTTNRYENEGEEKTSGVETELQMSFNQGEPFRQLDVSAHWTQQNSRRREQPSDPFTDSKLTPKRLINAKVGWLLPWKIMFINRVRWESEQFENDNRQGLRIPGFAVWDSRISIKIWTADLFFEVQNALQERYAESYGTYSPSGGTPTSVLSPQPGRTFWVGASILFLN